MKFRNKKTGEIVEWDSTLINSSLVSAQNRQRLYWANWDIPQPEDKGIFLKDIVEHGEVDRNKSYTIDANYFKGGNPRSYFEDGKRQLVFEHQSHKRAMVKVRGAAIQNQVTKRGVVIKTIGHGYIKESEKEMDKYPSLCAQSPSSKHLIFVGGYAGIYRIGTADDIKGHDYNRRIYSTDGKSPTLNSNSGGNLEPKIAVDDYVYRKLTPIECERLQTVEDNWTAGVSNTQRYKMLGNGWTIDVIAHILKSGLIG